MQHIVILGAGFAALTAVRTLRAKDKNLKITVVAPKPEFVFYPSLIWVPSGMRKGSDVVVPLQRFFERYKVSFHASNVTCLKDGGRTVVTAAEQIENDGLIIATGGRYAKKLPGMEHVITPCESVQATEAIGERLRDMQDGSIAVGFSGNPKEPAAVRGGPMFEFLFGIHTQLENERRRERFRLTFFNPMAEPGKRLGPKAVKGLVDTMATRGIETHLGHKLKGFESNKVLTEGGDLETDLILFMPGMTGQPWFENSELARSPAGFVQADAHCRVPGHELVYVAGDAGSFPGPEWLPKQAHMADLQATAAAENLLMELNSRSPAKTFRTELICVVDDLHTGMLVARTPKRSYVLPPLRILHWSKSAFEW